MSAWATPAAARPLAIAHRGGPAPHRENTLPAIEAAIALGAPAIEVDVRVAADGTAVVVHDATFARLWSDPRPVESVPWREIARLGAPGLRVPSLAEVLERVTGTGVLLVLDQKTAAAGLAAARMVERVGADRTAFCGVAAGLVEIRDVLPDATIMVNIDGSKPPDLRVLTALRPQYCDGNWLDLAPRTVAALHALAIEVCCWTPNSDADLASALDLGVDAVMTDRIDALTALLEARAPRAHAPRSAQPAPVTSH